MNRSSIKLKTIFGWWPVPIWFTNRWIPEGFGGLSLGVCVLIRPEYRNDKGLIEHELMHCRQCWRTWWTHPFRYHYSKQYRYQAEIEAWQAQIRIRPQAKTRAATMLATVYNLHVGVETALKDLTNSSVKP